MNFVELNRVSVRYGEDGDGTLALEGTTLAVAPGEFVAVVGPSGCGKSTLMKVVTGLWPPTAGTVTVDGREVAGPLSIVGMAFQNPTLLPWRKTLDNVMLPLEIGSTALRAVARRAVDLCGEGTRSVGAGRSEGI